MSRSLMVQPMTALQASERRTDFLLESTATIYCLEMPLFIFKIFIIFADDLRVKIKFN